MATSQFTAKELRDIASCLYLRATPPGAEWLQIRNLIDRLPRHLRASKMASLFARAGLSKKLCSVHDGLYGHVVSLIFDSLRTEVIDSVQSARQYAYLLGPDENMALDRTAGIEGMWKDPTIEFGHFITKNKHYHKPWKYQADQCQACMLSRVASNPAVLRELRTLILAKLDDKCSPPNHNHPLILSCINEWISLTDQKDDLFYVSGQRAAVIKQAKHEWRVMQANNNNNNNHDNNMRRVDSNSFFLHTLSESMPFSDTMSRSMPSLTEASTTPAHSSSLSRPPSRSAHEFSEVDSLLQNSTMTFDLDIDAFRLPPPDESYTSSALYDNPPEPNTSPQHEDNLRHFRLNGALSDYMHGPWSSTEALQDPRSRLPPSPTNSSADTLTSFTIRPEFDELHISPLSSSSEVESESEYEGMDGSTILPPLRTHSPLLVPPYYSYSSTLSPYSPKSGWSGNGQEQMFEGPRLVDVKSGRGEIIG